MHSKGKDNETRALLAREIARALSYDPYEIFDYSNCYYEGASPSLNIDKMVEIIKDVFKDNENLLHEVNPNT